MPYTIKTLYLDGIDIPFKAFNEFAIPYLITDAIWASIAIEPFGVIALDPLLFKQLDAMKLVEIDDMTFDIA